MKKRITTHYFLTKEELNDALMTAFIIKFPEMKSHDLDARVYLKHEDYITCEMEEAYVKVEEEIE
jgi:hypothetical protein